MNDEIVQWADKQLSSLGYLLTNKMPKNVQITPWSEVIRFETADGFIYLKHTPDLISHEPIIIQILRDEFNASVPEVIAYNTALNCFLMKDAGRPLREVLKRQFDSELLCKAIDQFTSLQIATAENLDIFLDQGVPDWRLDKLPDLFKDFLSQRDILIEDGLNEIEISELKSLLPKVSDLCEKLSGYPIKPTIVQPDFNDNNTLINEQSITIIDLGEIVISHPFFSLANMLIQMKKHHGMNEKDDLYLRIQDACLKNFMKFDSKENLLEAFTLAQTLWNVYWALANYRLMIACGEKKLMEFQPGKLAFSLRELLNIL